MKRDLSIDELRAEVADVPEPFATEWEQGDGYMVWVAAFRAPNGGVFMHRCVGAKKESFDVPEMREFHMITAKEHFKREMQKLPA